MAAAGWSDVPQDLLFRILRRLILVDCVRFGAVCSSWRSAARARRYPPARQPPWLMFPGSERAERSTARFLSLSRDGRDNKIYTLSLPVADLRDEWIFGSSHGWLFVVDRRCDVRMINPITGATIVLPPLSTFSGVEPVIDSSGTVTGFTFGLADPPSTYAPDQMQKFYVAKIVAVPGPAGFSNGDYTAVAIAHGRINSLSFARGGDDKWTSLLTLNKNNGGFRDVVFYKGLFYGVVLPGRIVALDLSGPFPEVKDVTMNIREGCQFLDLFYLVESSGVLLIVTRSVTFSKGRAATNGVKLFKLDDQQSRWVEVTSLGSRALFLGLGDSISLSTIDFPELRENCIYFTDNCTDYLYVNLTGRRDVGVYSLQDSNMCTELFHPYKIGMNWPPALWITPHM